MEANAQMSRILMRWADKMFSSCAMVQKVSVPWYSIHQKPVETVFERIRRSNESYVGPKKLKEFLSSKFPNMHFEYNGEGSLQVNCYVNAYIAMISHWCCQLKCGRATAPLLAMDRSSRHVIGLILQKIMGNEDEITCDSLQVIIFRSVEESANKTPDSSMVDARVEPTPKTKRLNELTAEVRELLARLLTKDCETEDAHDELKRVQEEYSHERAKHLQEIRRLQSRLSEVYDNGEVGVVSVDNRINPIIRQLESELAKCREIIATQRKIMEELDADIENQRQTIEDLKNKLTNNSPSIAIPSVTSFSSSIETRDVENLVVERLKTEIYVLKKEIERLTDHVDEKEARRVSLLTRNDNLIKSEAKQRQELVKISNEYDRLLNLADTKVEELKKLRVDEVRQLKEQIDALEDSRIFYLKMYNDARKQLSSMPIIVGEKQSVQIGANMSVVDEGDGDFDDETQNESNHSIGFSIRDQMASSTQVSMNDDDIHNDSVVDLTNDTVLEDDKDENESVIGLDAAGANNNPVANETLDSDDDELEATVYLPGRIPNHKFTKRAIFGVNSLGNRILLDGNYIFHRKAVMAARNGLLWYCRERSCSVTARVRRIQGSQMVYVDGRHTH